MRRLTDFPKAWIGLVLAISAGAQTVALTQNSLNNKDVVSLAKAGFNEDFIIDAIMMSRTRFDTSVGGLADLAKEGLTERLIRVMMTSGVTAQAPVPLPQMQQGPPPAQAMPMQMPVQMIAPSPETRTKTYIVKPSASAVAVATQTPYYEWKSYFWGLFKKRVGISAVQHPDQIIAPQLGGFYQQVRMPQAAPQPYPYYQQPYYPAPTYPVQGYPVQPRYVAMQ